jgi:hypothetical protein
MGYAPSAKLRFLPKDRDTTWSSARESGQFDLSGFSLTSSSHFDVPCALGAEQEIIPSYF